MTLAVRGVLVPRYSWGTYVKRTFIAAAAILALTAAGHADELSDIQAQAKQLREQNWRCRSASPISRSARRLSNKSL